MSVGLKIGALVVVIGAGIAVFVLTRKQPDLLPAKVEAAKSAGVPLAVADLKLPSVADGENGAMLVLKGIDKLLADKSGPTNLLMVAKAETDPGKEVNDIMGERYLAKIQPEMELIAQATEKPVCQFPLDWSNVNHLVFPHLLHLKNFEKAFCFQAEQLAKRGDLNGSLQEIELAHKVANLFDKNPLVINMLLRVSCNNIVEKSLCRIIDLQRDNPKFLAAAKRLHDTFGPLPDYRKSMESELVFQLSAIDQLKTLTDIGMPTTTSEQAALATAPIDRNDKNIVKSQLIRAYTELFKALPKDPEDWNGVRKALYYVQGLPNNEIKKPGKTCLILLKFLLTTHWDNLMDALTQSQSRRRMTNAAIGIWDAKAKSGKLPEELPNLGADGLDPFTSLPYKYHTKDKGFVLWGVGMNRKEDDADPKLDDVLVFK